jgi:hypothetical protein
VEKDVFDKASTITEFYDIKPTWKFCASGTRTKHKIEKEKKKQKGVAKEYKSLIND